MEYKGERIGKGMGRDLDDKVLAIDGFCLTSFVFE